ncbi:OmpA family protein [Mucilaginibacter gotjawali]|uniref:OOP family OmpA-OmpF porin n=2 Tax=Mucilaginibacter gotjawali TaxID=1550579 RepID=A0A839SDS8_9SPHI|nr:OmpA family protein [Mucilaginibacter gotjawali]MBB3055926.1 OOP family OmpA-OmpF porin [Mucilaginibacter gotjawali]BAU54751.1 Outer membrane porin F precursor [Mucilaginibacter gotjawali]
MAINLKRTLLLLIFTLNFAGLFAQNTDSLALNTDYIRPFSGGAAFRSWSVGIHAGLMSTSVITSSNSQLGFTVANVQYGYGGYIKKQLLPSFGLQADFMMGKLNGDNAQLNPAGISPYKSFTTAINYAGSLSTNFTLANINWHVVKSTVQPFITAGVGLMNYKPVLTTSAGVVVDFNKNKPNLNELYVPIGAGFKFDIAKGINLELAYQVNFVYSGNFDGYKYGNTNDKFSYAHIGLEFAIGKKSKPQLAAHNPVSSMRQEYLSGIQNARDEFKALIDSEKNRNQALQQQVLAQNTKLTQLTTDSDGDGVPDFYDKCPNTPAGIKVDGAGCPLPVVKPEEKIIITEADKSVVNEAIQNLQFASGTSMLSDASYQSLDKLAKLLKDKKYHLKLAGYTDATGSAALNLKLSKDRAEAIKMYLVSKGADPASIQTEGYGKANPIASNKTATGRKLNRRVEFSLY